MKTVTHYARHHHLKSRNDPLPVSEGKHGWGNW